MLDLLLLNCKASRLATSFVTSKPILLAVGLFWLLGIGFPNPAVAQKPAARYEVDVYLRRDDSSYYSPLVPDLTVVQWDLLELTFSGPAADGMSASANPFKIQVDVTFTGPDQKQLTVPAFFDGDGSGSLQGNVWKVRFSPHLTGEWTYVTQSNEPLLNGHSGSFIVVAPSSCLPYQPGSLPDFSCAGRLVYSGEHYLKLSSGGYWLKGGEDNPEDFLAPGANLDFDSKEAALAFLRDKGVNSIYMLLTNIDGDFKNVWPWVGQTQAEAKVNHEHFDIVKLAEWDRVFTDAEEKGIVLHLVLEDDQAWTGFNRTLFYREMVARFGYHNNLIWNLVEEYSESYSSKAVKSFAQTLKDLDPYDHPVTVHHVGSLSEWDPFLGDSRFDLTSFQTDASPQNAAAANWFNKVKTSGRAIPISFDETGAISPDQRALARHIVWSVYLGGGNFEMYTAPEREYKPFAGHFEDMTRARKFVEELPFQRMEPANDLLLDGKGYVFAQPGEVYAVYLPQGGEIRLSLSASQAAIQVTWFNPRTGESTRAGSVQGGSTLNFEPPFQEDAVLRLVKVQNNPQPPPPLELEEPLYLPALRR